LSLLTKEKRKESETPRCRGHAAAILIHSAQFRSPAKAVISSLWLMARGKKGKKKRGKKGKRKKKKISRVGTRCALLPVSRIIRGKCGPYMAPPAPPPGKLIAKNQSIPREYMFKPLCARRLSGEFLFFFFLSFHYPNERWKERSLALIAAGRKGGRGVERPWNIIFIRGVASSCPFTGVLSHGVLFGIHDVTLLCGS
jgi:hypothetical protein